jgi:hypothetical protein
VRYVSSWLILVLSAQVLLISQEKADYPYKYVLGNDYKLDHIISLPATDRKADAFEDAIDIGDGTNLSKLLFYTLGYKKFLQEVENARNDKQLGAPPTSQGATSIVSKGVASQVLSVATETGALSRSDSKTTSTFHANPLGIARLLSGASAFPYCAVYDYRCESRASRALEGLSASVSFFTFPSATSSSSLTGSMTDNSSVLDASAQTIAGWTVRYDFHVRRSTSDLTTGYKKEFDKYQTQLSPLAGGFGDASNKMVKIIGDSPDYKTWRHSYGVRLQEADPAAASSILLEALQKLDAIAKSADPTFQSDAEDLMSKMTTFFGNRDALLATYINKITFSVEYDNDRPTNQPSQSTAKLVLSARPASFQLTANGSVQWNNQLLNSSVSRVRDAQAALQLDQQLGKPSAAVSPTLSVGYYFQYMVDNALLTLPSSALAPGTSIPLPGNASILLNTKGAIHLGQAKITFKIKNSGIQFPIALTFSNRTDLIKASEVRGNFGITYDLDSLFASAK